MSAAVIASVVCAIVGLGAGIWGGFRLGVRWGRPAWRYWLMNGVALLVCLGMCALSLALTLGWLAVFVLGLLCGLLTGMKYGIRGGFVIHPGALTPVGAEPCQPIGPGAEDTAAAADSADAVALAAGSE